MPSWVAARSCAQGDEANRGSLEVGNWADLSVLAADPLTDRQKSARPADIPVLGSYLGGVARSTSSTVLVQLTVTSEVSHDTPAHRPPRTR